MKPCAGRKAGWSFYQDVLDGGAIENRQAGPVGKHMSPDVGGLIAMDAQAVDAAGNRRCRISVRLACPARLKSMLKCMRCRISRTPSNLHLELRGQPACSRIKQPRW